MKNRTDGEKVGFRNTSDILLVGSCFNLRVFVADECFVEVLGAPMSKFSSVSPIFARYFLERSEKRLRSVALARFRADTLALEGFVVGLEVAPDLLLLDVP